MKQFENLEVWKDARQLTQRIYHITQADKFSKDFALRDQIRRATVFIMSNIAEGFERGVSQEFTHDDWNYWNKYNLQIRAFTRGEHT